MLLLLRMVCSDKIKHKRRVELSVRNCQAVRVGQVLTAEMYR